MQRDGEIVIVGGGIGGLTLALALDRAGIRCRVFEAASRLLPLGVGINLLPHATQVLSDLGVLPALEAAAVTTRESAFFNRFGQLIYREPAGRFAGWTQPQLSIHRADLHAVLAAAVRARMGPDAVVLGARCDGFTDDGAAVTVRFKEAETERAFTVRAPAAIGADGIWSVFRKQLYPAEGAPRYSGVTMWRGTTVWEPSLTGASMVRAGWLATGKMVIYPIRDDVDGRGRQLVNWVAEIETPQRTERDWTRAGNLDDFAPAFAEWTFDWLDVPALLRAADRCLEFPMVDQDPLPGWTFGRVTLLGDAAHPMVPRGSNGAAQAILDAAALAEEFARADAPAALAAYDARRREAVNAIVLRNRTNPPDAILRLVYERTGDAPFRDIADVASEAELRAIADGYRTTVGIAGAG